ncbi:hypothetical protein RB195_025321 [Necator americanus]|uniref:Uncharacterized protein n=1 Tax=Necator americanus TaxID=51031 RepID=A0ABR1ERU9_NECAM
MACTASFNRNIAIDGFVPYLSLFVSLSFFLCLGVGFHFFYGPCSETRMGKCSSYYNTLPFFCAHLQGWTTFQITRKQTMSALTDFDTITNQNVIAGLTAVPKQCMVVESSRLFADNPSLSYTSSYGSDQFEAVLFEQAVQYAATTAASQAPFRSTVPSIYSPSPSGNNNTRTTHDTNSSRFDEGCLLDDDEDGSILSNLPNSCHDFELKELHIRLERNHSSPLIGGHTSPAVSSRLSSNCPSTEPPIDPAEPEDLEVQFINECFEEQQRQNKMYQSGNLKTLFYHGSSEIDSSKAANQSGTDKSAHSSLERPERLPYAKKLSTHDTSSSSTSQYDCRPVTSPTFSNINENFEPLLTPKSEALIKKRAKQEPKASSNRRRVSEPLAQKPPLFWNGLNTESGAPSSAELLESANIRHLSFDQYFHGSTPESVIHDPLCCEGATETLSKGVLESLFAGVVLTPSGTESEDHPYTFWKPEQSKAVRSLYMDHWDTPEYSSKHQSSTIGVEDNVKKCDVSGKMVPLSDLPMQSKSRASDVDAPKKSSNEVADVVSIEEGDSWEDLDDMKLEQQMKELKLEVYGRPARHPINYFAPPVTYSPPWDPTFLSHVLEAYDVPEYKLAEDVVNALASTDWCTASVKWLERKMVFIVFGSERQGTECEARGKVVDEKPVKCCEFRVKTWQSVVLMLKISLFAKN